MRARQTAMLLLCAVCCWAAPAAAFLSGDSAKEPRKAVSAPPTTDAFDGRWMFTSAGCPYTGPLPATIKHGRVIVRGGSEQVNPDGFIHTVGAGGGMTLTAEGRLDGETGSGTFARSDGCGDMDRHQAALNWLLADPSDAAEGASSPLVSRGQRVRKPWRRFPITS
jgi:hypothetical protein